MLEFLQDVIAIAIGDYTINKPTYTNQPSVSECNEKLCKNCRYCYDKSNHNTILAGMTIDKTYICMRNGVIHHEYTYDSMIDLRFKLHKSDTTNLLDGNPLFDLITIQPSYNTLLDGSIESYFLCDNERNCCNNISNSVCNKTNPSDCCGKDAKYFEPKYEDKIVLFKFGDRYYENVR